MQDQQDKRDKLSRRELLGNATALSALAVFGVVACGKKAAPLTCTDTSALAPADLSVRTALAYTDISMEAGKSCLSCQQFVAPAAVGTCGTCKVLKGPINPTGYCKSFVAKTA
jgi:hypothetical protein